jgi:hypothetical protein
MDFLDPKKRRSYNIRLFIGFVLITIAIVLATVILALITAGYTINRKTGQVVQNSLVFINSQPVSSSIYLNGTLSGTTNARFDLSAGNYNVSLSQPGYRTWSNKITLYGGQVEQLIYPFLFATNPTKTTVSTYPSQPAIATYTPDRHWYLVSDPTQTASFNMVDINNIKTPVANITLPNSVFDSKTGNVLSVIQWSTDNIHLLLKDTYSGGVQYIMLDRTDPTSSFNVSDLFPNTSFDSIKMDNQAYNKLYLYDSASGTLYLGDVTAKTVTSVLTNVLYFWPYSTNQILYMTPEPKDSTKVDVNIWTSSDQKSQNLRDLPASPTYLLNMASYNGSLYAVIGSSNSRYAYIYMNPLDQLKAKPNQLPTPYTLLVTNGTPENVTFSNSARFIALQSGGQFSIYDIQYDTHYRYNTGLNFATNQLATWMDGNRLNAVINGELNIWDFDGTNNVAFVNANADLLPTYNSGYTALYTVVPNASSTTGQWQLLRYGLVAGKP